MPNLKLLKTLFFGVIFFALALCSGCGNGSADSPQKLYGEDSNYYIGLRELANGDEKKAARAFSRCAEKGSPYVARRSAEELTKIGDVQERLAASKKFLERYDDEAALLVAMRQYEAAQEYTQILVLTESIDMRECSAELARIRLEALFKTHSAQFENAAYDWYTSRSVTAQTYQLYQNTWTENDESANYEIGNGGESGRQSELQSERQSERDKIINFRIDVYRGSFREAYEKVADILNITFYQKRQPLTAQLVSDMGRACLYGSGENLANAQIFDEIAAEADDKTIIYNAWFYAARLYDRTASNYTTAAARFVRAMESAETDAQFDNALWYLLSASLRNSTDDAIAMLETYGAQIRSPAYFDDFFESLASLLLSVFRFDDFKKIYELIDGHASDEATAKFAYIYGRLVQEGFVAAQFSETESPEAESERAFKRALMSGGELYYKMLAGNALGLSDEEMQQMVRATKINNNFIRDENAERLLLGYALFGLPEKIYPEWTSLGDDNSIGLECAVRLSDFLNKTAGSAGGANNYYALSLRIISRAVANSDVAPGDDALKLLYPLNYQSEIESACEEFSLDAEVMYALIRTESFFDPNVVSSAGAVGLAQLMELTAADIAQHLGRDDFSLQDAETNIEFGAYYLASLIRRLDGSTLAALFSYNAGITRVRRWMQNFRVGFGREPAGAYDLFLETVPYAETRDYGRKLLAASAMYGSLYFNKSIQTVVDEMLR